MDEELEKILADSETSNEDKQKAINDLISNNFVSRTKYNNKVSKNDEAMKALQAEYDTFKQEKMTEEEKKEEEEKQRAIKYTQMSERLSTSIAEGIFAKSGLKEDDYKEVLPNLIQSTPEATEEVVNSVCEIMKKQKENIEANFKAELKGQSPKPEGGNAENQNSQTDMEKLEEAYSKATNPIDQANILTQINELNAQNQN